MDSEAPAAPTVDKVNTVKASASGRHASKRNPVKVSKRIHKAEREKMKREHLNDLFLSLANALELSQQNSGKASILDRATRILTDMLSQIEGLKRENEAFLSESQYMTVEKNELQDEKKALEDQIGKLQDEIKEKSINLELDQNIDNAGNQQPDWVPHLWKDHLRLHAAEPSLHQAPSINPVYVIPFPPDFHADPSPLAAQLTSKAVSTVSKPQARYPTPADSWPAQILEGRPELQKEFHGQ